MRLCSDFLRWARHLWRRSNSIGEAGANPPSPPRICFGRVEFLHSAIDNADIESEILYCIYLKGKSRWILFRCPCGCQDVITLSVQDCHKPHWSLYADTDGGPTIYPSVWRDKGCLSHFWIRGGRVFWCEDTGAFPYNQFR